MKRSYNGLSAPRDMWVKASHYPQSMSRSAYSTPAAWSLIVTVTDEAALQPLWEALLRNAMLYDHAFTAFERAQQDVTEWQVCVPSSLSRYSTTLDTARYEAEAFMCGWKAALAHEQLRLDWDEAHAEDRKRRRGQPRTAIRTPDGRGKWVR